MLHHFRHRVLGLASVLLLLGISGQTLSAEAAERITLKYGPFSRSVSVSDLREYATTGNASSELKPLLGFIGREQRRSLTNVLKLKFPFPLSVTALDKLLRGPAGNLVLPQIAKLTELPGDGEVLALRSALILSAASEEGLGALSILDAYPTPHVTLDLRKAQKLQKTFQSDGGLQKLLQGGLLP